MEFSQIFRLFLSTYALFPFHFLFWLVVILVGWQYRRTARSETQLFGRPRNNVFRQTLVSALFGLAAGLLASAMLVLFGISLLEIGIPYVWGLAIVLLLVHPRYLCFAYAGGIVAVVSALLRLVGNVWPFLLQGFLADIAAIHIPGLLALIGILHLTESLLIAVSGHYFTSPVYVKTDQGIVGGFSLQKFWPLPLVGLVAQVVSQAAANAAVGAPMPEWWPIFPSAFVPGEGQALVYILIPIVAGLGYGDIAVSLTPKQKSRKSAVNLGLYSLILIGAAFLAYRFPVVAIPAALFSPFGHELLILLGNKNEFGSSLVYRAPAEGVGVLDLFPDSKAAAAGLKPFDIIRAVNGYNVNDTMVFGQLLSASDPVIELDVNRDGEFHRIRFVKNGNHGIIPFPDRYAPAYVEVKNAHFFTFLSEKIQKFKNAKN